MVVIHEVEGAVAGYHRDVMARRPADDGHGAVGSTVEEGGMPGLVVDPGEGRIFLQVPSCRVVMAWGIQRQELGGSDVGLGHGGVGMAGVAPDLVGVAEAGEGRLDVDWAVGGRRCWTEIGDPRHGCFGEGAAAGHVALRVDGEVGVGQLLEEDEWVRRCGEGLAGVADEGGSHRRCEVGEGFAKG